MPGLSRIACSLLLFLAPLLSLPLPRATLWDADAAMALSTEELLDLPLTELMNLPITTASRVEELVWETPSTIIVVTANQIRTRRYVNLADLLDDLPGVDIQRATHSTEYNDISIRGYRGSASFLILRDGIRIDSPIGGNTPIADNLPLYYADRVEILYGPASAVYGADAAGGVINIISRRGGEAEGLTLQQSIGDDGYRYTSAFGGLSEGNFDLTAGAHTHQQDGVQLARDYPETYAAVDATDFAGNVVIPAAERESFSQPTESHSAFARLDWGSQLSIGVNHSRFRNITAIGMLPEVGLYLEDSKWDTRLTTVHGDWRWQVTDDIDATTRLIYSGMEVDPKSRFMDRYSSFNNSYSYAEGRKRSLEQEFQYRIDERHTLVVGGVYDDVHALPRVTNLSQPYSAGLTQYYPNTDIAIHALDTDYHNAAGYLLWKAEWSDALSSNIGLRYDHNSDYDGTFNPRLGLAYQPNEHWVFKASYGHAYRAPSPLESLIHYGSFTGQQNENGDYISYYFHAPSEGLEPEESDNYELALSWHPREDFNLDLNLHYTEVENTVVPEYTNPAIQFLPGAEIYSTRHYANLGHETHYGADLILNHQRDLGAGWQLDLWGNYSYLQAEAADRAGAIESEIPFVTEHKLKLGATFGYLDRYFITPKLRWIGEATTGEIDPHNPEERIKSDAYLVTDLHLGIRGPVKNLSLYLDIHNLFDRRYGYASGGGDASLLETPAALRSFILSLSYEF